MAHRTAPDEIQKSRILEVAAGESRRDAALITLGFAVGLRSHELRALTLGQVHDGEKIRAKLRIERAHLKGGRGRNRCAVRSRVIPNNPEAAAVLESYLAERGAHAPLDLRAPLFRSREGAGGISCRQIRRIVHRVFSHAGLDGLGYWSAPSLRRHFARKVYALSTTESYLGCDSDRLAAIIRQTAAALQHQPFARSA